MSKQVGFGYGALCDELEVQANQQGYTLGDDAKKFEKKKKAITTLLFGGILTDSQSDKAYQKLNKQVTKSLKPTKEDKNERS